MTFPVRGDEAEPCHDLTAGPADLAAWIRGHWSIENKLRYVRDVTFAEDHSRVRQARQHDRSSCHYLAQRSLERLDRPPFPSTCTYEYSAPAGSHSGRALSASIEPTGCKRG